jgi:bifunctional non-homologous end joining protein LigD
VIQDVAIVGFVPEEGKPKSVGALLVAVADAKGKLSYAGQVTSGISEKQRSELAVKLLEEKRTAKTGPLDPPPKLKGAVWSAPRLVAELTLSGWSSDGQLLAPRLVKLRTDKAPLDCQRTVVAASTPPPKAVKVARTKPAPVPVAAPDPDRPPPITVALTHPDKLIYPTDGLMKKDVVAYYEAVSGPILRAMAGRPTSFERYQNGIGGEGWYQQNIGKEGKPWMTYLETETRGVGRGGAKMIRRLLIDTPETLRWLGQFNILTIHMWASHAPALEQPDWVIFDLDPDPAKGFVQTIEPALAVKQIFDDLGVPIYAKTSGKKGLHLLVPLAPGHTFDRVGRFAHKIAQRIVAALPDVTIERSKAARHGRLYFDYLQNGYGKTIVAPYSPRATAGAPVSAPLRWEEVTKDLDPKTINLRTMPARLAELGDLFAPVLEGGVELPDEDGEGEFSDSD